MRLVSRSTSPRRITPLQRLGRVLLGFCLGWVWSSVVCLLWLGALYLKYGDVEEGLHELRKESWGFAAVSANLGSMFSCWAGSVMAPAVIGPTRLRYPVIGSSFLGGMTSVIPAAVATGWMMSGKPPQSEASILWMIFVGIAIGMLAGCVVGWLLTSKQQIISDSTSKPLTMD